MSRVKSGVKSIAIELLTGFAIGAANIIPGVSGGTFLLIFGLYEKVVGILNGFSISLVKEVFLALISALKTPLKKSGWLSLLKLLDEKGFLFLFKLFVGAAVAIVSLSSLLKFLLSTYPTVTYGFFFGLILLSVVVPVRLLKKISFTLLIPFVLGVAVTTFVSTSVNPYDKMVKKSDHYKQRYELQSTVGKSAEDGDKRLSFQSVYTPAEYVSIAIAGAVAISAMVLPGISGSLVLILMGQYFAVISAISGAKTLVLDHFLFLGVMSVGMVLGVLLFVKLIDFVFSKWHDGTMSLLTGLIAGSLVALWPFKKGFVVEEIFIKDGGEIVRKVNEMVYTNINTFPESFALAIPVIIFTILGIIVMVPFLLNEKK